MPVPAPPCLGFPHRLIQPTGAGGAYTINGNALGQACTTLEAVLEYLANGAAGSTRHPDIRVRPKGQPVAAQDDSFV